MDDKQGIKEEKFENIVSGLERAGIRLYKFSLLVFYPSGFWKYYTIIGFILAEILGAYFLIVGAVAIIQQMDDIFILFESVHAYLIMIAILTNLNDFYIVRPRVRNCWYKLLVLCKEDFFEYECKYVKREAARLRMLSKMYMKWFFNIAINGIFVTLIMVMVVIPLVRLYLNEEQKTDNTSYNVYLPLSVWSPFNSRTVAGYAFNYSLLFITACHLLIIMLVYISTIFYFFMELIIQLRILCFALEKHDQRLKILRENATKQQTFNSTSNKMISRAGDQFENYCITKSLEDPILHYLKIREFFNVFQEACSFFFGLMLSANMLVIVAMSLLLTRIDSILTVDGLKFCMILSIEIVNIFIYTYSGSMLVEESHQVQKYLYSIEWYGFTSNQKKTLNIFQNQSGSKFLLMAAGLYNIDLDTFIQVMQTAYSVFNVFNNMKS